MKVLCGGSASDELTLFSQLESLGLGGGQEMMDRIIKPLCACDLVTYTSVGPMAGRLIPNHSRLMDVEELVGGWKFDFPLTATEGERIVAGLTSQAPNGALLDARAMKSLESLLPEGEIAKLRGRNQIFQWDVSADGALIDFLRANAGPHKGFLDETLEALRNKLHEYISLLLDKAYRYTDDAPDGQQRRFTYHNDTALFDEHRDEVIVLTESVVRTYDELIMTGRRKFAGR